MSRYKRRKDGGDDGEDSMDERKKKGTPRKVVVEVVVDAP